MNLIENIGADFMTAFKAREMDKKNFLGLVKSTLTEKTKTPSDEEGIALLKSMLKKHNASVNEYGVGTLTDLEVEIVEGYLPSQLDGDELTTIVGDFIVTNGLGVNDMGKVMGYLKSKFVGQYDGKLASNIVKSRLSLLV